MKTLFCILFLLSALLSWGTDKIKIACIGNSITYGANILNREKNSYPAQLQTMLGNKYEVKNFGVNGRTILSKGDLPYIKTSAWNEAREYNPDIVFIKLGTNDSKSYKRIYLSDYKADYKTMIQTLKALPSHPRIILLTPLPAFTQPDTVNITTSVIEKQILPLVEQVAYETGSELIHLYHLFTDAPEYILPDKIHPSSIGAGMIAARLYEYLTTPQQQYDLCKQLEIEKNNSNFYGYPCHTFKYKEHLCRIVTPRWTAQGRPWIWRARFWGHEPQTDIALLERGFHLVYCDVADLYGSPEAVKRWDHFYAWMQKGGLNPKVTLEAMSRGGLIVYNWAAANPAKVACIYADAPVLDLKSWPLGAGIGQGSEEDIPRLMKAYGFENRQNIMDYTLNPIDRAAEIAAGGFPILHVCGDADDIVPVAENTAVFEKRILENGGTIRIIHKPDVKHHPHSLKNPAKIVDFILQATGNNINFAVIPVPGNEYRSGAGWKEKNGWWENHEEINRLLQTGPLDLLLIGNSITQGFAGNREIVTHKPGLDALNAALPGVKWESAGISGDRTQNVLFRILNGNYQTARPKNVILTIGVNNLYSETSTAAETAQGIIACAEAVLKKMPDSRLTVFCTLPAGKQAGGKLRRDIIQIGKILEHTFAGKPLTYINLYDTFVNPDGTLKQELYSGDYLHLNTRGYQVWANEIRKQIK